MNHSNLRKQAKKAILKDNPEIATIAHLKRKAQKPRRIHPLFLAMFLWIFVSILV